MDPVNVELVTSLVLELLVRYSATRSQQPFASLHTRYAVNCNDALRELRCVLSSNNTLTHKLEAMHFNK